jgi:AraC-like DNA-binding protein
MAAIQHALSSGIWDFEFEPAPGMPFSGEGRMQSLPGLVLADVTTSQGRTRRAAHHRVDDQFLFNVCLSGSSTVSQCGREITVGEGDAILSMGAEIAEMQFTASRFLSFRIPAKAITALVPDVANRAVRRIARDTEALKLLTVYAGGVQDVSATPALRLLAVTHVHDLVALALGAARDAADMSKGRGLRAARLQAIKADIENELAQDVSLAMLASRHRLPLRYVRRLFEEEGTTFTEFVLSRRLARAHRLLLNPRAIHLKIGTVATEAGFNNLSYFNEAFRRRYGATPSDVRAQAAS